MQHYFLHIKKEIEKQVDEKPSTIRKRYNMKMTLNIQL